MIVYVMRIFAFLGGFLVQNLCLLRGGMATLESCDLYLQALILLYVLLLLQFLLKKFFNVLSLTKSNTFEIELSPDRKNLCYSKQLQYIDNNTTLGDVFHEIIQEVRINKEDSIIYCQTRKQCAILRRAFKLELKEDMYCNQSAVMKECIVQMFHSGTPKFCF